MNKIKRGVSLLLCSLLFGSAVTLGNVADVQAGKQIKTETKQTINNTKAKKKVSDDQTSGKTGRNEENKAGEGAQTDIAESKVMYMYIQRMKCCLLKRMLHMQEISMILLICKRIRRGLSIRRFRVILH